MANTFDEVKAIIVDLLGVDEGKVKSEARFREDLEADSLDLVELIMKFEDVFGTEISDEDAQKIVTVGDAVTFVEAVAIVQLDSAQVCEEQNVWGDCAGDGISGHQLCVFHCGALAAHTHGYIEFLGGLSQMLVDRPGLFGATSHG